jgi:nucleoid DNA-binding protein
MNKAALESKVSEKLGVNKIEAARMIKVILDSVIEGAIAENECVLPGIGKLKVLDKKASSGEALGKKWSKPAHKVFKLVVTKEGKESLA